MNIVNLTPHDIILRHPDVEGITVIPKSGAVARVTTVAGKATVVEGIPCPVYTADAVGGVENVPPFEQGTWLLVSGLVGSALAGTRSDVLVPGTGPKDGAIRNEKGWIVAVTRLKMV